MKPTKFYGANCTFAENQPEYLPLPAHKTKDGTVISCWKLTWMERLAILITGRLWISVLTFNKPLQPQLPSIDTPFVPDPSWD